MKKTTKNRWASALALTTLLAGLFAASPLPAAESAKPPVAPDDRPALLGQPIFLTF